MNLSNYFRHQKYEVSGSNPGLLLLLIVIGIAGRLIPHPPNVTPMGGMAVWAGVRLGRFTSLIVVLLTMIITDSLLGGHRTLLYVYGSMVLGVLIASTIRTVTVPKIVAVTLLNSVLFFLITNFGVWFRSSFYPQTWEGLIQSYVAAIPFFRASLIGDAAYTAAFFCFEYLSLTLLFKRGIVRKVI